MCLTLVGLVLITCPSLLFGHSIPALASSTGQKEQDSYISGAVLVVSATLFGGNAYVLLCALKGLNFSIIMTTFGSLLWFRHCLCHAYSKYSAFHAVDLIGSLL
jgi:uncharacterized membrane protein YgdD (TMEM256/DUF423 family)